MKKRMRVRIYVVLAGMILWIMQPFMLFAGETGVGNPWDTLIYPSHYTGTRLAGPLSIYYQRAGSSCFNMNYTVRLSEHKNLYLFQGYQQNYFCPSPGDTGFIEGSGQIIMDFLATVVAKIFPGNKGWVLKAIDNGMYHDEEVYPYSRAFVADITITVKE
jgi:hypothetical protein